MKEDRGTRLHVGSAAAVQRITVAAAGQVVGCRHGVQMPGQQHPRRSAERCARQHGVAVADDLETGRLGPHRRFHLVGDALLVPRLAGYVDQSCGQLDRVAAEVQHDPSVVGG